MRNRIKKQNILFLLTCTYFLKCAMPDIVSEYTEDLLLLPQLLNIEEIGELIKEDVLIQSEKLEKVTILTDNEQSNYLPNSNNREDTTDEMSSSNSEEVRNPLFLTPLIKEGRIDEAKKKAHVFIEEFADIQSYAGYITINEDYNSNTFFWYFPSQNHPETDPIAIWLAGGPGTTSLLGLLTETGPFAIDGTINLVARNHSWHGNHSMIYVDNPIGTGFSFTENDLGYARSQKQIASDVVTFLVQFFELFPELRENDFYVAGDSYGGTHVVTVSQAIKFYNDEADVKINLQGLSIGNGVIDLAIQATNAEYLYQLGLVDFHGRDKLIEIEENIKALARLTDILIAETNNYTLIASILVQQRNSKINLIKSLTGYTSKLYLMNSNDLPERPHLAKWTEKIEVRKALHARNEEFIIDSDIVMNYLTYDIVKSEASVLADLLKDYRVLFYSGQLDMTIPFPSTEMFFLNLNWTDVELYKIAKRHQWWVGDELAGYWKIAGNLLEVLVRNSGHVAPREQPLWTREMFTCFTHQLPLE